MKVLSQIIILLLISSGLHAQSGVKSMFSEKKLPSVEITDLMGQKVDVSSYGENGKITVFNFWATWCSPCKEELSNIDMMYEDWQEMYNMELVAVSIDDSRNIQKVKTEVEGKGWSYIVLLDTNQDLKRYLNFQTVPYTVVVDETGTIVYTHIGYNQGDEYILEDKLAELAGK
jgi:thiol-disulfide isomerase/thioredoxin